MIFMKMKKQKNTGLCKNNPFIYSKLQNVLPKRHIQYNKD